MALATQCPHCYTSFRVANDQLKLHAGMVRCGACKQTFNGIEHLLEPGEEPRKPPVPTDTDSVSHEDRYSAQIDASTAERPASIIDSASEQPEAKDDQTPSETIEGAPSVAISEEFAPESSAAEQISFEEISSTDTAEADPLAALANEAEAIEAPHQEQDLFSGVETVEAIPSETKETAFEPPPTQQELDDIALFQEKLASFSAQIELPEPSALDTHDDQHFAEHASAQLETITQEPESTEVADVGVAQQEPEKPVEENSRARKQASLTASLDFELSDEERSWNEHIAQANQLELQTQAAIVNVDESKYSKHEPVFSDETILEEELEQDLHQLLSQTQAPEVKKEPTPAKPAPVFQAEPAVSTTDLAPENEGEDEQPEFMLQAEKALRYNKLKLATLLLVMTLLVTAACAQGIYFFRSGIAAHFPQTKPWLVQMCQRLNCQVKLPTQIDMISVDSHELLNLHQDPHIHSLTLQLQNKSNMAQAWPMVELILKDSRGKTVLQRVFRPEEYLEQKSSVSKGIAANSDNNIKVHFELTTMKAAGYAVTVFYP